MVGRVVARGTHCDHPAHGPPHRSTVANSTSGPARAALSDNRHRTRVPPRPGRPLPPSRFAPNSLPPLPAAASGRFAHLHVPGGSRSRRAFASGWVLRLNRLFSPSSPQYTGRLRSVALSETTLATGEKDKTRNLPVQAVPSAQGRWHGPERSCPGLLGTSITSGSFAYLSFPVVLSSD